MPVASERTASRVSDSPGLRSLSPLQRILVTTDGTVTNILEAYAGEPVQVLKLSQVPGRVGRGGAALEIGGDTLVLRRRVLLQGSRTGTTFLYAESEIVLDRLHPAVRRELVETAKPIGALLGEHRVESFREILAVGQEVAGPHGRYLGVSPGALLVSRSYRVWCDRRPVMVITEKFPSSSFTSLCPP